MRAYVRAVVCACGRAFRRAGMCAHACVERCDAVCMRCVCVRAGVRPGGRPCKLKGTSD